ncbi:MAG: hypothetical protein K0R50_884 [Eubacterium sp.]|jgi:hypothetical protein|nr:hypothetical protein [Eubacterium sp.]
MINQLSLLDEGQFIGNKEKTKTIISASRRTDIPAFYYEWLQEVLEKGQVEVPNPRFPDKKYAVDLEPSAVHSIVLWSKDFSNVLKDPMYLKEYNLYFQYTINNYSRIIEPNVPEYRETLATLEGLLKVFIPQQFNIRFDPVILSTKGENNPTPGMPEKARLKAFEKLCRDLRALGMEKCRITTSYLEMYGHVRNRLLKTNLDLISADENLQTEIFSHLAEISQKYGFALYSCASPILEKIKGIHRGHCIDGEFLERLFGEKTNKSKDGGQRKACGCSHSRDIGVYSKSCKGMKCLHGCKYCYVMDSD